jgi:hypothetical protein
VPAAAAHAGLLNRLKHLAILPTLPTGTVRSTNMEGITIKKIFRTTVTALTQVWK